jgi:hypothetical protein
MKYYAICDVYKRERLEIRQYSYCTMNGERDLFYYAIYDDELKALRECNELNREMDAEYKCVVVEMEV